MRMSKQYFALESSNISHIRIHLRNGTLRGPQKIDFKDGYRMEFDENENETLLKDGKIVARYDSKAKNTTDQDNRYIGHGNKLDEILFSGLRELD